MPEVTCIWSHLFSSVPAPKEWIGEEYKFRINSQYASQVRNHLFTKDRIIKEVESGDTVTFYYKKWYSYSDKKTKAILWFFYSLFSSSSLFIFSFNSSQTSFGIFFAIFTFG